MTGQSLVAVMVSSLAAGICSSAAFGKEASPDAARQVFDKHQDAVVWVTAVMKMRAGGALGGVFGRQEQKVEAVGTVIHESGLTVLSYTVLDPTAMLNAAMAGAGGGGLGEEKLEFKSELSGVKIRLADGTEVAARLVLKDDDLDLAFVMPTEKGKKLPHLSLSSKAEAPKVRAMDEVISVWRLGQDLDRQAAVGTGRVAAVVTKPRTFYVCSGVDSGVGAPAFLGDGTVLGVMVFRRQGMESAMRGMFSMSGGSVMSTVVVPAADVMEVAEQALTSNDDAPPAPAAEPAADETKL